MIFIKKLFTLFLSIAVITMCLSTKQAHCSSEKNITNLEVKTKEVCAAIEQLTKSIEERKKALLQELAKLSKKITNKSLKINKKEEATAEATHRVLEAKIKTIQEELNSLEQSSLQLRSIGAIAPGDATHGVMVDPYLFQQYMAQVAQSHGKQKSKWEFFKEKAFTLKTAAIVSGAVLLLSALGTGAYLVAKQFNSLKKSQENINAKFTVQDTHLLELKRTINSSSDQALENKEAILEQLGKEPEEFWARKTELTKQLYKKLKKENKTLGKIWQETEENKELLNTITALLIYPDSSDCFTHSLENLSAEEQEAILLERYVKFKQIKDYFSLDEEDEEGKNFFSLRTSVERLLFETPADRRHRNNNVEDQYPYSEEQLKELRLYMGKHESSDEEDDFA